MRCTA